MENKRPYWQVGIRLLFSLAATAAFVIIGIKAIGFLMPFVIGWIISAVAAPLVNWLEKRLRIVKKLGSALIVILVLGGIVGILYLGISRLILEVASLVRDFPSIYAQLESGLSQIGDTLSGVFDRLPEVVQNGWNTVASNLDCSSVGLNHSISVLLYYMQLPTLCQQIFSSHILQVVCSFEFSFYKIKIFRC